MAVRSLTATVRTVACVSDAPCAFLPSLTPKPPSSTGLAYSLKRSGTCPHLKSPSRPAMSQSALRTPITTLPHPSRSSRLT
eukprot:298254-Prymnesium_polylepis.1